MAAVPLNFCFGIFRSASTWAFNVMIAIARSRGETATTFADDPETLALHVRDADTVVVKSHVPTPGLTLLVSLGRMPAILTVRDPLDCVASLMDSFGETFEAALKDVAASARALAALQDRTDVLVIRYEDEGAQGAETVQRIAEWMGMPLEEDEAEGIAAAHTSERIRALIDTFAADGVFDSRPPRLQHDLSTHWHPQHIGTGRTGVYADILSPDQAVRTACVTHHFRQRHGYEALKPLPVTSAQTLAFNGCGLLYCVSGFADSEEWGVWTNAPEAQVVVPLGERSRFVRGQIAGTLAPVFLTSGDARIAVRVNGRRIFEIGADAIRQDPFHLGFAVDTQDSDRLELTFEFSNLVPVDPRLLGLALQTLSLAFDDGEA